MKSKHTVITLTQYLNLLESNNLPLKYTLDLTELEILEIDNLLIDMTYTQVANHFKIKSQSILQRALKKKGYINKYHRVRANFNEDYFENIDTPEKAYILGFIMADGCITGNCLAIELSRKDVSVLEFIKEQIKFDKPLEMVNKNDKEYCKLRITSTKIINDLEKLGIHRRKTFTIDYINLNNNLQKHLIHGWFDGDGSISLRETGKGFIGTVSIIGNTLAISKMIDDLKDKLNFEKLSYNSIKEDKLRTLVFQKKEYIYRFYNWIYKDITFGLKRKKERMELVLKNYIPSETSEVTSL